MNLDNESRLAMITYRQEKSMNKSHADTSTEVHRQRSKGKDTKRFWKQMHGKAENLQIFRKKFGR